MFHPQSPKPKGTLHFSNMTWQKVQITVEAAAMADAAPSSRNGYSSSQRIFSPENMFWAHEAFIAEGQVRIIQVG